MEKESMEYRLLDRCLPAVAEFAELLADGETVEPVPYSEFEKALAEVRVAEVLVSDRTVTGRLKSPDSRGKTTIVATRVEPDLADRLSKYDVPYARVLESTGCAMCCRGSCQR